MPKNVLTDIEFRDAAKAGTLSSEAEIRKGFVPEWKTVEGEARALDFTISTASVDRMGDTIAVDGWKLSEYRKNPVVLWAHDAKMMPVAKASNIRVEDGKLKARAEFMPREISGFADAVYRALKAGFLSATSVGFAPMKYSFSEETGRTFGIDFLEQELLEFSIVPIPANPEALIEARAAGIDIEPMKEWAEKLLKGAGMAVLPQQRFDAIAGLPDLFRGTAKKLPDGAKGHRGQILRCANIAERAIKGDGAATPAQVADDAAEGEADQAPAPVIAGTPRLAMAQRRLTQLRRSIVA